MLSYMTCATVLINVFVPFADLMQPRGISVNFLPLDSLPKLAKKVKYNHFFSRLYFSAR